MKECTPEILEYLKTERVGVLAVQMLDNSPHAATVHFAHSETPLTFYFETYREYRKCEALFGRDVSKASFVVGFKEGAPSQTLQMDGEVRLLQQDERKIFDDLYLGKFPEKREKSADPKFVFFKFTPTWWRFTKGSKPEGKQILTSDDAK